MDHQTTLHAAVLDRLRVGVAVLSGKRHVTFSNAAFSAMTAAQDGLQICDGKLRAMRGSDEILLQAAIDAVIAGEAAVQLARAIPRPSGRKAFVLTLTPLWADNERWILLSMLDPSQALPIGAKHFVGLFGLTPAEAAVAAHVVMGHTLELTAAALGNSVNTCRHHLEKVFRKTGVARQADLVRLLLDWTMLTYEARHLTRAHVHDRNTLHAGSDLPSQRG